MPTGSAESLSQTDLLKLDYQQTTDMLKSLTDIRFKLLALVPSLSGATVAVIGRPGSAAILLSVGLLGLVATLGVLFYELRSTQLAEYAMRRARHIEAQLGLHAIGGEQGPGGPFSERPGQPLRLLGITPINRDGALALVYGAALAGWTYLVAWGAPDALDAGSSRKIGAVIGVVAGLLVIAEVIRLRVRPGERTR